MTEDSRIKTERNWDDKKKKSEEKEKVFKRINWLVLQQIAYNHSLDIDFKDFMNLDRKCTAKPFSLLVIDATCASDNPSRFRKNI